MSTVILENQWRHRCDQLVATTRFHPGARWAMQEALKAEGAPLPQIRAAITHWLHREDDLVSNWALEELIDNLPPAADSALIDEYVFESGLPRGIASDFDRWASSAGTSDDLAGYARDLRSGAWLGELHPRDLTLPCPVCERSAR